MKRDNQLKNLKQLKLEKERQKKFREKLKSDEKKYNAMKLKEKIRIRIYREKQKKARENNKELLDEYRKKEREKNKVQEK